MQKTETPEQTAARHDRELEATLTKKRAERQQAAAERRELERLAAIGRTANKSDRVVRLTEVLKLTGLSRATVYRLERVGTFPKRRKLTENTVGWDEAEVLAWNASRPRAK